MSNADDGNERAPSTTSKPTRVRGSFTFFVAVWVSMMAAMMLPGAAPAVLRRAHADGRVRAVPLFVGSYIAVWTLVGAPCTRCTGRTGPSPPARLRSRQAFTSSPHSSSASAGAAARRPALNSSRALLRRLEHRSDADAGGAGHERDLDVCDRRPHARPEAPARESRHRCTGGAGDGWTRSSDRPRAVIDSRTHATDVRRHRRRGPRYGAISDTEKARTGRLSQSGSLVRSLPSPRLRSLRRWRSYAPLDCGSWHHWPRVAGSRWPGVALAWATRPRRRATMSA